MPILTLSHIANTLKAKVIGDGSLTFDTLVFDSRKTAKPESSLFIAIAGERHNGHDYVAEMYQKGIRCFLISDDKFFAREFKNAGFLLVPDTIEALQSIVADFRAGIRLDEIVAITGSNGKTIVKEWLAGCLSQKFKVVRSPKSYNSQIGVPLSVWLLNDEADWGVFEAGISKPNEMEKLRKVINPKHSIITNIGEAHQQNFINLQEKLAEKLILFRDAQVIYYCHDHDLIHEAIEKDSNLAQKKKVTWSLKNKNASLFVQDKGKEKHEVCFEITYENEAFDIILPFTDKASIENALHVITFLLANGITQAEVGDMLNILQPVAMRLEQLKGINNCTLINDAYNSDINGMAIALDSLKQTGGQKARVIISDLLQTGLTGKDLYGNVAQLLNQFNIQEVVAIGKDLSANKSAFNQQSITFYESTADFIEADHWKSYQNETILIKGARGFQFEKIVHLLSEKNHTTVLETNLSHLNKNLNYFRSLTNTETKLMVMVKALAYGSGALEIAHLLQHEKVDYLGVAFTDEGIMLRQAGIHLPIMVMAPNNEDFDRIIEYDLEPEIYGFTILNKFSEAVKSAQLNNYPVHLKLDTGMHRLGFLEKDMPELLNKLSDLKHIRLQAVFSHLAASNEKVHDSYSRKQIELFSAMYKQITKTIGYKPMRHILNSAGIERFPEAHFEMVRLGIGLHGISSTDKQLKPVSRLKTHIVQVKEIDPGETVGYSRRGVISKKSRIAIIPIGYADGLDRKLGNGNGYVMLNDKRCPYIGSICMDMSMVDISGVDAMEGDEVLVFGEDPSIKTLAEQLETIPYEVLTNISSRVKRVYSKD